MIEAIQSKVAADLFEFSKHALDQSLKRGISVTEVREAIATARVIEDYPADKYGPTCLLLGYTTAGRPIHVLCSYPERPLIKIVTVYEPDAGKWTDFRERKP
jgi:hypothetical protein